MLTVLMQIQCIPKPRKHIYIITLHEHTLHTYTFITYQLRVGCLIPELSCQTPVTYTVTSAANVNKKLIWK